MKNEILTCISNKHDVYNDSFKSRKIKIGRSYKCIDVLTLTSPDYYRPEFASLAGVTIISGADRWGWSRPCLPKECFRVATTSEIKKYKLLLFLKMPFYLCKIYLFKICHKIDRIVRWKYYKKLMEDFY